MIKLFENQKHSIYEYQQALGLSKYTLYNYASGKRDIKKINVFWLYTIAEIEDIDDINGLYQDMIRWCSNGSK